MNLRTLWCDIFHRGGEIKRDCYDRINWQCSKCRRWAIPVDLQTERLMTDKAIRAALKGDDHV